MAGEVADAGVDALAAGPAQPSLVCLRGDLGNGPGGLTVQVTLFPDGNAPDHVARIALRKGRTGQDRELATAIPFGALSPTQR